MQHRLVVYQEGRVDLSFPVSEAGARIGRDSDNHVQLVSPDVSKHHATLVHTGNGWHLRDAGSRNGTFVNGRRVQDAFLHNGDRITVGPYELVFETGAAAADEKPVISMDLSDSAEQKTLCRPPPGPPRR